MSNPSSRIEDVNDIAAHQAAFPHDRCYAEGLNKREYFAVIAMHALIKSNEFAYANIIAENACQYADFLIAELNKPKQ